MAAPIAKTSPVSPQLQRVLDMYREEAERLREQLGDPNEALSALVREHFDFESLDETLSEGGSFWVEDVRDGW